VDTAPLTAADAQQLRYRLVLTSGTATDPGGSLPNDGGTRIAMEERPLAISEIVKHANHMGYLITAYQLAQPPNFAVTYTGAEADGFTFSLGCNGDGEADDPYIWGTFTKGNTPEWVDNPAPIGSPQWWSRLKILDGSIPTVAGVITIAYDDLGGVRRSQYSYAVTANMNLGGVAIGYDGQIYGTCGSPINAGNLPVAQMLAAGIATEANVTAQAAAILDAVAAIVVDLTPQQIADLAAAISAALVAGGVGGGISEVGVSTGQE
jgi:hypothetical protein